MRVIDTGMLNVITVEDKTYASFHCPLCSQESAWEYDAVVYRTIRDKGVRFVSAEQMPDIMHREFLLSGLCRECQEAVYGDEDDEE